MKAFCAGLALTTCFFLAGALSATPDRTIYKHPTLAFQFEASEGWLHIAHPEDRLIYHMAEPGGVLNVMLWYTETEQDAPHYLKKMADMKGYQTLGEPAKAEIHRQSAWVLPAVGVSEKGDLRVMLAGIRSAKGLYIVQIWCPLERWEEEKETMEAILSSVEVGP